MSLSATEHAARIRKTLKGFGISSKQVSVRSNYFSMGSSIDVTIKDPAVPKSLVEAVASPAERIDRDHFGEILSGCNRYVSVNYSGEVDRALAAPYLAKVEAALASVKDNYLADIEGLPECRVGKDGHRLSLWGREGHIAEAYSAHDIARRIGEMVVNS